MLQNISNVLVILRHSRWTILSWIRVVLRLFEPKQLLQVFFASDGINFLCSSFISHTKNSNFNELFLWYNFTWELSYRISSENLQSKLTHKNLGITFFFRPAHLILELFQGHSILANFSISSKFQLKIAGTNVQVPLLVQKFSHSLISQKKILIVKLWFHK